MKKISTLGLLLLAAAPFIASAQQLTPLRNLVAAISAIVHQLIPVLIGIAILVFFWGLIKYIRDSGKGHVQGRNIMIAGLISIFVMVSLFGIIAFAGNALGIANNSIGGGTPPTVNGL